MKAATKSSVGGSGSIIILKTTTEGGEVAEWFRPQILHLVFQAAGV